MIVIPIEERTHDIVTKLNDGVEPPTDYSVDHVFLWDINFEGVLGLTDIITMEVFKKTYPGVHTALLPTVISPKVQE